MSIIDRTVTKSAVKNETYSDKGEGLATARQIVVNNGKGNT